MEHSHLKGQYFSFDAIIATVIMVLAMTALISYWFGTQSVTESRANPLYPNAIRVAESLFSEGVPANWTLSSLDSVSQLGLLKKGSQNELDKDKILKLEQDWAANYTQVGKLLRSSANYYIEIKNAGETAPVVFGIGNSSFTSANEVAIAHRGAIIDESGRKAPVQITVYLWR